jgi:hypothetical protein
VARFHQDVDLSAFYSSLFGFIATHLLIALGVVLIFVLIVWLLRRRNRANLRTLLGEGYSEENSFIGAGISICVDNKSRRFAVVDLGTEVLCTADELVSAELTTVSADQLMAQLLIVTNNAALPRVKMVVWFFRQDRLAEIHSRMLALQNAERVTQRRPAQTADLVKNDAKLDRPEQTADSVRDDAKLVLAVGQLNHSIVTLTEVVRNIAEELREQHPVHSNKPDPTP